MCVFSCRIVSGLVLDSAKGGFWVALGGFLGAGSKEEIELASNLVLHGISRVISVRKILESEETGGSN